MNTTKFTRLVTTILLFTCISADAPKLPDAPVAARQQFDDTLDRLNRDYATKAAEARDAYRRRLENVVANETKQGRFEAAELAKAELKQLDLDMPVTATIAPGDGDYTVKWTTGTSLRYGLHGDRVDLDRGKRGTGKVVRQGGALVVTYDKLDGVDRLSLRTDGAILAESWKQRGDLAAGKPPDYVGLGTRTP
jgi:hypothetical protein